MRKSKWFWAEVYRLNPKMVERCAAIFQLIAARESLRETFQSRYDAMALEGVSQESLAQIDPDRRLAELDDLYRIPRRWLLSSMLAIGTVLTIQPWFEIRWFSSVIMVAGAILCALEFLPKPVAGFTSMVQRIHNARKSSGDK